METTAVKLNERLMGVQQSVVNEILRLVDVDASERAQLMAGRPISKMSLANYLAEMAEAQDTATQAGRAMVHVATLHILRLSRELLDA